MIRTRVFPCSLPKDTADALNRESGRIYTGVLVEHYRILRHSNHWLSPGSGEKLSDYLSGTILHAHSRDAAQQGFYKACKTAQAQKAAGMGPVRYPHHLKKFRTSIWKNTGIRKQGDVLLLAMARGDNPIRVCLPTHLANLPGNCFWKCGWSGIGRADDITGTAWWKMDCSLRPTGKRIPAVDLGEIHPAAVTDGEEGVVFCARELRSCPNTPISGWLKFNRCSRRKKNIPAAINAWLARKVRFLAKQKRKRTDIEHKVSRSVVQLCGGKKGRYSGDRGCQGRSRWSG